MARLSTRQRKKLPARDFAGPDRSYPINDKPHARAALSRASHARQTGRISAATYRDIKRKANAKLHSRSYRKGSRR